jgi:hypothetical protein
MPTVGCAPDITETNYVNIGFVVRVLIRQFGPPPLHDIQFFLFLKLDITVAIRSANSFFFVKTCTVLVAGRSIGLMMYYNRRKWNLLVEQSTDDVAYYNHTLQISHVDGFQSHAIYARKNADD